MLKQLYAIVVRTIEVREFQFSYLLVVRLAYLARCHLQLREHLGIQKSILLLAPTSTLLLLPQLLPPLYSLQQLVMVG